MNLVALCERPAISVDDVEVSEAPSGTTNAVFEVRLSSEESVPVTVHVATADGTAQGGLDYAPVSQDVTFAPGDRVELVVVPIFSDAVVEGNETFSLLLSANTSGTIIRNATGTIIDGRRRHRLRLRHRHRRRRRHLHLPATTSAATASATSATSGPTAGPLSRAERDRPAAGNGQGADPGTALPGRHDAQGSLPARRPVVGQSPRGGAVRARQLQGQPAGRPPLAARKFSAFVSRWPRAWEGTDGPEGAGDERPGRAGSAARGQRRAGSDGQDQRHRATARRQTVTACCRRSTAPAGSSRSTPTRRTSSPATPTTPETSSPAIARPARRCGSASTAQGRRPTARASRPR